MKEKKSESPIRKSLLSIKKNADQEKKSGKSLLKRKSKENKKGKKKKLVIFGVTLFLMIVCLFVYSLSFLLAPSYTLRAVITTVHGGYDLSYEICTVPTSSLPQKTSVGDIIYIKESGAISHTAKNALRMKVISINSESTLLEFDISDVPFFVSTTDMKSIVKNTSGGKVYSHVYISGKVIGGRFVLQKLHF